jgi:hypothetical protein
VKEGGNERKEQRAERGMTQRLRLAAGHKESGAEEGKMTNGGLCYGERANKRARCRKRRLKSTGSITQSQRQRGGKDDAASPDLDASRVASKSTDSNRAPPRVLCLRLLIWRDALIYPMGCVRMSLLLIILPGSSRPCASVSVSKPKSINELWSAKCIAVQGNPSIGWSKVSSVLECVNGVGSKLRLGPSKPKTARRWVRTHIPWPWCERVTQRNHSWPATYGHSLTLLQAISTTSLSLHPDSLLLTFYLRHHFQPSRHHCPPTSHLGP